MNFRLRSTVIVTPDKAEDFLMDGNLEISTMPLIQFEYINFLTRKNNERCEIKITTENKLR